MFHILLVIHVIITAAMIGIILIQRNASDGLGGLGGGGGGGFMTSRGQANLLTRTTAVLAALFIVNSLALSWLTQRDVANHSIADKITEEQSATPQVPMPGTADKPDASQPVEAEKEPSIPQPAE